MAKRLRAAPVESRPVAIAFSDSHLSHRIWVDRPLIQGDAEFAMRQIVDLANAHGNLPLLGAGDLLDAKLNTALTVDMTRRLLERIQGGLWHIQGQHEAQRPVPWLEATGVPGVVHIHEQTCVVNGARIAGIDWLPAPELARALERLAQEPPVDILLLHQLVHEWIGGITPAELSLEQLPPVPVVVIGDYHKSMRVRLDNGTLVLSCGATHMRKIDEPHEHSVWLIKRTAAGEWDAERLPLLSRPHLELELLVEGDLDRALVSLPDQLVATRIEAIAAGVPEEVAVPTLRVFYPVGLPGAHDRLLDAVGDRCHLFVSPRDPREDEEPGDDQERLTYAQTQELGLRGCLPLVLDPAAEPLAHRIVAAVLDSEDPRRTLVELRDEHLAGQDEEDPFAYPEG